MKVRHCHLDEGCCEERSGTFSKERFLATTLEMTGRPVTLMAVAVGVGNGDYAVLVVVASSR